MASGLAHELNQPLCAAMNYANACLHGVKSGSADMAELVDNIEEVARQTERAGQIVNSIKNFVKKRRTNRTAVNINDTVKALPGLIASDINRNGIRLKVELDDQVPTVLADPIQMEQVLLNLVLNGIDAMADSKMDRRQLVIRTRNLDGIVQVDVCDKGHGIPEPVSGQMFDSFFTTKPDGLGIGLSISRSIIEAHQGKLRAGNNPDGGATITFTLPAAETIDRFNTRHALSPGAVMGCFGKGTHDGES